MKLESITPLILTFNEEANIDRCLSGLGWAREVLVVDSGSDDRTVRLIEPFSYARVVTRCFDNHTNQWNAGLDAVTTEWVLTLDADYVIDKNFVKELKELKSNADVYFSNFRYAIFGKCLRASLYPPRAVLFRPSQCRYVPDGHTQLLDISERTVGTLKSRIIHDDNKPLGHWVNSQLKYAELEAEKLESTPRNQLGWKDRLRTRYVIAPFLTVLYCLFYKGLILDGWAGIFYTFQRVFAELTLSLKLLDRKLRNRNEEREDANAETTDSR